MAGHFDHGEIEIPCPGCGEKTKKTVAWLKANHELTCAGCSARIELQDAGFKRGIEEADKAIDDLARKLKRL